jgi:hypothetical protein
MAHRLIVLWTTWQLNQFSLIGISDVNVSFFCERNQFFFCFRSWKNEWFVLFNLYKTKILNVDVWFFFRAQSSLNKTLRFVSRSNQNPMLWSALVSISNLNEILSLRSKSCIRSDMKCAKNPCLRQSKAVNHLFNALQMYFSLLKLIFRLFLGFKSCFLS